MFSKQHRNICYAFTLIYSIKEDMDRLYKNATLFFNQRAELLNLQSLKVPAKGGGCPGTPIQPQDIKGELKNPLLCRK